MNLIGIIAISVLAALFLFALLAATGVLVWLALRIRKDQVTEQQERQRVYAETEKLLAAHQTELKAIVESARSGFGSIRTDMRASLDANQKVAEAALADHQKALAATLDTFRQDINEAIKKINAEALATVAVRLTQVCIRAEKAIAVFQQLILSTEQQPGHDYAPDAFAPEESAFGAPPSGYAVSQTARLDQEADIETGAEVASEAI
jgi:phage tail sheath protein FI